MRDMAEKIITAVTASVIARPEGVAVGKPKKKEIWLCVMDCAQVGMKFHKYEHFGKCDNCGRMGYRLRPILKPKRRKK